MREYICHDFNEFKQLYWMRFNKKQQLLYMDGGKLSFYVWSAGSPFKVIYFGSIWEMKARYEFLIEEHFVFCDFNIRTGESALTVQKEVKE